MVSNTQIKFYISINLDMIMRQANFYVDTQRLFFTFIKKLEDFTVLKKFAVTSEKNGRNSLFQQF